MALAAAFGWVAGIPALTTFGTGGPAAQPLSATVFGLIAAAHLLGLIGRDRWRLPLLVIALAVAALSQIDVISGNGRTLSRALVRLLPAAAGAHMAVEAPHPIAITEAVLLILALLPATATRRRRARLALMLATIALLIGAVVMIGYVNQVDIAGAGSLLFVMSLPSAAMSLMLAWSVIVWRYRDGWPAVFWTAPEESAGWLLLPVLLILIAVECSFRLLVDHHVIDDGIADALMLVANMAIIVVIVVPGSQRLADRRRERDELAGAVELAAVMVLDRDGVILHWSRGCADLYGWPSELALGRRRHDLLRGAGGQPAYDACASPGAGGSCYSEIVEHHRDGRRLITANHAKSLSRAKDCGSSVVAVTDITDRRATEAALRSSEERLRAAISVQGLTIVEFNLASSAIDWTVNLEALCGSAPIRTEGDFGAWAGQAIDAKDWADVLKDWNEVRRGGTGKFRRTVRVRQGPGEGRLFEMSTQLIYDESTAIRSILACNDVTEHYLREEAIMLGEARLATAVAAQGIFIYEYDLVTERPIWTTRGEDFLGVEKDDAAADAPASHWDRLPEVARQVRSAVAEAIDRGQERIHFSFAFERLDGQRRQADSWARIVRDAGGAPIRVIGTHLDITERHEREAALRASAAEMRAILATVPDAMIVCDERGLIRALSATAAALFGYKRSELIGRSIWDLAADPDTGPISRKRPLRRIVRDIRGVQPTPVMVRRSDGAIVPVSFVLGDAMVGGQRMFVAFGRDMRPHIASEEKFHKLQNQLGQAARLATMGEMGAALAHELSQPLAAIVNFLGAATLTMQADDNRGRLEHAIRSASEQASRAAEIIKRLRALISRGEAEMRTERITDLIREAAALALLNISSLGVRLSYDFEDENRTVMADGIQIQQILVNLIRNGVDAMTGSGSPRRELIISTKMRGQDFLEVDVIDTGPGIDPDIVGALFSPFTTTKNEGLGLGLSICRRIVEAHGGQLSTDKSLSGGAIFRFTLPVANR